VVPRIRLCVATRPYRRIIDGRREAARSLWRYGGRASLRYRRYTTTRDATRFSDRCCSNAFLNAVRKAFDAGGRTLCLRNQVAIVPLLTFLKKGVSRIIPHDISEANRRARCHREAVRRSRPRRFQAPPLYRHFWGGRPYRLELLPGEFVPSKRVAEVSGLMPRFQSSRSVRG
jgi:hypothetical protein